MNFLFLNNCVMHTKLYIEPYSGEDIGDLFERAHNTSRQIGRRIYFEFNGDLLCVSPKIPWKRSFARWQKKSGNHKV